MENTADTATDETSSETAGSTGSATQTTSSDRSTQTDSIAATPAIVLPDQPQSWSDLDPNIIRLRSEIAAVDGQIEAKEAQKACRIHASAPSPPPAAAPPTHPAAIVPLHFHLHPLNPPLSVAVAPVALVALAIAPAIAPAIALPLLDFID
ncbi:hypothetical protein EDC01DRAFT_761712 [Geopyxis carbonaria]|nr:hypothetical protein EDC01DRAFT_761712 [Geopyxis carbonaria]